MEELVARFGVSRGYVYKLVSGNARPLAQVAGGDHLNPPDKRSGSAGPARMALDALVAELGELSGERAALGAVLADRLDAVAVLETAAAGSGAERVAGRLEEIVDGLAAGEAREGAGQAAARMLGALA